MTKILLFLILTSNLWACDYLSQSGCEAGQRCVYVNEPNEPQCVEKYLSYYPRLSFPFSSEITVSCDQGPEMRGEQIHSHAWINTMDALDLRTEDTQGAGNIYAGLSGSVIVFDSCKTKNDKCGAGFGNQVKILNEQGYLVFYAHLEKVFVKTGDFVNSGTLIGVEGNSGWTGKNNRHLHMSVHFDWRVQGINSWLNLGWLPKSIPFEFEVFVPWMGNQKKIVDTKTIRCIRRIEDKFYEASLRGLIHY